MSHPSVRPLAHCLTRALTGLWLPDRSHQSTASPWGSFAEVMFRRVRVLGQPRSPLASSRARGRRSRSDIELGSPFEEVAVTTLIVAIVALALGP